MTRSVKMYESFGWYEAITNRADNIFVALCCNTTDCSSQPVLATTDGGRGCVLALKLSTGVNSVCLSGLIPACIQYPQCTDLPAFPSRWLESITSVSTDMSPAVPSLHAAPQAHSLYPRPPPSLSLSLGNHLSTTMISLMSAVSARS